MKSIEVVIAGRKYPVKVSEDEEETLLNLIEEIDQKFKEFQSTYRGMDKQDYLSMTLLTYALDYASSKESTGELDTLREKADAIIARLDTAV